MSIPIFLPMSERDNALEFENYTLSLNNHGIMVLMASITSDTVRPVIEWILHENLIRKRKLKELLLLICSAGGNIEDGFALIDVMASSAIPIKTVGLGQISSAALMIFLAGAKGRRVLTPNTSVLSHQYTWGTFGKEHEIFATVKEFSLIQQRMLEHYQKSTGLDQVKIKEVLLPPHDVYLSAQEALDYKICDQIADIQLK